MTGKEESVTPGVKDELPDDTRMSRLAPHLPLTAIQPCLQKATPLCVYINKERSTYFSFKVEEEEEEEGRK